jgi:eukaryotic-like serine/threonine-protein kinase
MSKILFIGSILITILILSLIGKNNTTFSLQDQKPKAQNFAATTSKLLIYTNPNHGIKIQYPINWTLGEHPYADRFLVDFTPALKNISDSAPATVTLSIETVKQNTTLNGFTIATLDKAKQSLPGFQIIESNATILAGNPAHRITYAFASTDPSIQLPFLSMNVWTIKHSKVYNISYTEAKPNYVKYLPIVQNIIDSFKFTN